MTKRLMVIDALNAYFRAYIVDPSLSTNGNPIGGYQDRDWETVLTIKST